MVALDAQTREIVGRAPDASEAKLRPRPVSC
jgi:hypothetical protein